MPFNLIRLILGLALLTGSCSLQATGYFEYTPKAKAAYQKAISLQFSEARILVNQIKYEDPENLIVHHIENYIDFFTVFINENKEEFVRLEKNKDYRIKQIRKGDENSPYFLYTQAEIRLQWALARTKFEEYFTAFTEVKTAYKQLTKNQKTFPAFVANKKSLGILHALVGTVPDSYRWGVKLLGGMDGSIEQGQKEIKEIVEYSKHNDFLFEEETLVMYAFLLLHLKNQDDEAWGIIRSNKLNHKENPLACFALANVAMRSAKNDEAIRILQNRASGPKYAPFPYLDYMLGLAKLYRQDADANVYIEKYLREFKGLNYIKEAYQKLAWHQLLKNNKKGYESNIAQCKVKGAKVIEADENAWKEANSGIIPDKDLLKARLLFDGGYFEKAYAFLKSRSKLSFAEKALQLEYSYRMGRITHKLSHYDEAIGYYQQTIDQGKEESYFFACNAALQIGHIYEHYKRVDKAREYYSLCLSLKPDEYKNGLHQKAKAGLNRLKNK